MNMHRSTKKETEILEDITSHEIDPKMSYRALNHLERQVEPKCGFDVAQLEVLFPEEMNEYQKWSKVRLFDA